MRREDTAAVSVAMVMYTYKGDVNPAIGENSKRPLSPAKSTEASFDDDDCNAKSLNVNKVCQQ